MPFLASCSTTTLNLYIHTDRALQHRRVFTVRDAGVTYSYLRLDSSTGLSGAAQRVNDMDSTSFQEVLDTVLWVLRPIGVLLYYIGMILLSILQLLSGPILTALQPIIYLFYAFYVVASLPIRLIAKLEVR